tara:strand:+ start:14276 stop:16474 length:2199 start_codon:yes stop_codon:yes gene_type:complete
LKDLLLITPPFTQLNTPYPGTAYLKGFLNTKGISSFQMDLGIDVIQAVFCKKGLNDIFSLAKQNSTINSENAHRIFTLKETYIQSIDAVILFLQGNNATLARKICTDNFLPKAARFEQLDDLDYAFGNMGMQDRAKHLATLYLEDLSDFIVECVDEKFGFSRYAESLGQSANNFDALYEKLNANLTYIDQISLDVLEKKIKEIQPKLVGLSVPFPGNLYSAFRCGQLIKKLYPSVKILMGGGFPNTELRTISDPRVFDFVDFICLDDGERPIEILLELIENDTFPLKADLKLKRTFYFDGEEVIYNNKSTESDYKQSDLGTPDYSDLPLDKYISVIEIANPMHSLWSDGRWNKLTMAHGCYWGKCTFCDISLDYIKLYEPLTANILVDRMEQLVKETGESGFHFVDEAAPPALMRAVALEIIKRKLTLTWWTNIRFEKSFSLDLCLLLSASGCIAISGGLEVASDRLLKLIDKGVTVEQVAQVTRNFTEAGIMVHAYLMYGYPTQTIQETIDSLEMVRQLFEEGVLRSGFWHQFALTAHSPIGLEPEKYHIIPNQNPITFANNDIAFKDKTGIDHSKFSYGLKKSLFNFMHGIGFDFPLQDWFEFKIPRPTIGPEYIVTCLEKEDNNGLKNGSKMVWLGHMPVVSEKLIEKKKKTYTRVLLTFHTTSAIIDFTLMQNVADWLLGILSDMEKSRRPITYGQFVNSFEDKCEHFDQFFTATMRDELRACGLLIL